MTSNETQSKWPRKAARRRGGGVLLTAEELAVQLGEQERTVWTLYRNGILPGYDLGYRLKRFRLSDCLKALEKRKVRARL
jgi:hypothetical protein